MANALNLKLKDFKKTLTTLNQSLAEKQNDFIKDAVIKRFEYCFELCWKTAKVFLSEKFGVDIYSPKECFRELRKNKLISDKDAELFLEMTDDRNEIIHTYNKNFADKLHKKIVNKYYKLIKESFEILSK